MFNLPEKSKLFSLLLQNQVFHNQQYKILIEDVDVEKANLFSKLIIKDEYDFFYNHIRWHEYNRKAMGLNPFVTEKTIDNKMDELRSSFFDQTKTFLVNIPDSLSHKDFLAQLPEFINKN